MCNEFLQDVLDLINRKKAEIDRLQKAIKVQDIMLEQKDHKLKRVKTETVKEFAERAGVMITEVYNKHIFGANDLEAEEKDAIINFSDDITSGLEGLAKEMTEAVDGKL